MTDTYGAYQSIEDRPALRFERRLSHPIDVVWPAITDPASWKLVSLPGGGGRFAWGAEMTFRFEDMPLDLPSTMSGRVTAFRSAAPVQLLLGARPPVRITSTSSLEPLPGEDACVLRLTVLLDSRDKASRDGAGWHVCLDRLERLVRAEDGPAVTGAGDRWRGFYQEYQRRGVPVGAEIPAG